MNRENIKSLLLLFLVVTSFFLTQQLWIQFPYKILPYYGEEVEVRGNSILPDIICPEKYLINFGGNYTIFYSNKDYNLWDISKEILKTSFEDKEIKIQAINPTDIENKKYTKSIELYFAEGIPTYIFPQMLNVEEVNGLYKRINRINKIYIPLNGGNFIVLSDNTNYLMASSSKFNMDRLMKEIQKIEKDGYTRYYSLSELLKTDSQAYIAKNIKMKDLPSSIYVKNEININNEAQLESIAKGFFGRDIDYVRKIEENDGSVIYIYNNEKVLKISSDGLLTYYNSLNNTVTERNLYKSLQTAVDFISLHIGWPDDAYIYSIEEIEVDGSLGYRLTFDYRIGGKAVVINEGRISNPIEIEVFNDEVKQYTRFIRDVDKNRLMSIDMRPILPPDEIISMTENYYMIKENYKRQMGIDNGGVDEGKLKDKIKSSINDIYIAYYDPCYKNMGQRLMSVWVIVIEDTDYIFDAYTGKRINIIGGRNIK
jgi:regulatory protein YycH of two-component signal transduction system YycFG